MHERILSRRIRKGTLILVFPGGRRERYGAGEPAAEWIIHDPKALRRIAADPEMAFGETYMDGAWSAGEGGLVRLLEVLLANFPLEHERGWRAAIKRLWQQGNRIARSHRNASHHYDIDEWLFRHFLDREMHYSCAYFARPDMSLEEAQEAKARHIAAKLLLRPGMRVLDIGCGWGSLARYLARHHGVHVTGLTLSKEQLRAARAWAEAEGLADQLEFRLEDYREHRGRYDRIVSVGMFEHVGQPHYRTYFERAAAMLAPDGVMLLHTIGRLGPPSTTHAWIRRYIFPGGYNPALSEVTAAIEETPLELCDVEVLRLHYAMTLAHWQERFHRHRAEVVERMGERFARMWEMYLAMAEASFRWSDMVVYQLQLALDRSVVPLTRDYLHRPEADASRAHDAA